jgi:hypothetical protein
VYRDGGMRMTTNSVNLKDVFNPSGKPLKFLNP